MLIRCFLGKSKLMNDEGSLLCSCVGGHLMTHKLLLVQMMGKCNWKRQFVFFYEKDKVISFSTTKFQRSEQDE